MILLELNGTFDVTGTATVKDTTTLENILQLKPLDTNMITPSTVCNSGQVFMVTMMNSMFAKLVHGSKL